MDRKRTLGLAAEVSFWVFLSLVPLAAVASYVAARIASTHSWITSSTMASVPPQMREMLTTQVQQVAAWRGGAFAPVALATAVWLASSGIHSIFDVVEVQTGTSRPWWKKRLLAIATCLALAIGVAVLALLAAGLDWVQTVAGSALSPAFMSVEHGLVGHALRLVLGGVVAFAMVAGLFRVAVPRGCDRRVPVLPGALLAVVLQGALGWGYGIYVGHFGAGSYQAGLAVVGVSMMTLWLFATALLLGAQLNSVLAERLRTRSSWPSSDGSSSPRTSPRPPIERSTGPSTSLPRSAHPSR
ncbi:MAG TPA: YihY/virulence factor BrkB family protein [Polyangiaceae bacterium]